LIASNTSPTNKPTNDVKPRSSVFDRTYEVQTPPERPVVKTTVDIPQSRVGRAEGGRVVVVNKPSIFLLSFFFSF